jgi:hypothetical protein
MQKALKLPAILLALANRIALKKGRTAQLFRGITAVQDWNH